MEGDVGGVMHQKPMLNSPVEVHSVAAEEFAKNTIERLEASRQARQALKCILFEATNPDIDRIEPDKGRFAALNRIFHRKTFSAAG
jgi:hypothetical protein